MKKIYLLMMLLATVFVACSDDDDDDDKDKPTGKEKLVSKIVTREQYSSSADIYTTTFEYNSEGKIQKVTDTYTEGEDKGKVVTRTFKKEGLKLIASYDNNYGGKGEKVFEGEFNSNGLVIKGGCEGDCDYTSINYDNSNQLINTTGDKFNCTWSNGNITSIDQYGRTTFTYTEYENKSNVDLNFQIMMLWEYDMFETSYFGAKSKNLIATRVEDGDTSSYEYTFDKEGYVTSIKQYEVEDGQKKLFITQEITYKE